jgi:hypothetical protein
VLATMFGITDQAMISKIDDEVQQFQWNLTDQDRAIVGDFGNVAEAVAPLDRQSDGIVSLECDNSAGSPSPPCPEWPKTELLDKSLRHRNHRRPGVDQGVVDFEAAYVLLLNQSLIDIIEISKILEFGRDENLAHRIDFHDNLDQSCRVE